MENKFNEREFLKGINKVNTIIKYVCSGQVAQNYISVVLDTLGYDVDAMFSYFKTLLNEHFPDYKDVYMDMEGWKKVYKALIKQHVEDDISIIFKQGLGFFKTPDQMRRYFELVMECVGINADTYITTYIINKIGWVNWLDTLQDMANELYGEPKPIIKSKKDSDRSESITSTPELDTMESDTTISTVDTESEPSIECVKEEDTVSATPAKSDTEEEVINSKVELVKKPSSKEGKRGYNEPIHQFRKINVFDTIEVASETTGIDISEILDTITNKPDSQIKYVWKYLDKKKTRVVQYEYFHTYANQSAVDKFSLEVCGKRIVHNNIQIKEWVSTCKSEFVWLKGYLTTVCKKESESPLEQAA